MNINDTDFVQQIIFDVYNTISFRGLLALWFLPSLFIAEILMYLVLKSPKPVKILSLIFPVVIAFLLTAFMVYLQETLNSNSIYKIISKPAHALIKGLIAFWFVFIGYYIFSALKRIKSSKLKIALGVSLFIINIFLSQLNQGIDFNLLEFGSNPILFYVCGLLGSVSITLIFEFLEKYMNFRILAFCGINSLVLFATHLLFGITENLVFWFDKIFSLPLTASVGYLFDCLVILAVLLIIEYLITIFINKKALFLIGKK